MAISVTGNQLLWERGRAEESDPKSLIRHARPILNFPIGEWIPSEV